MGIVFVKKEIGVLTEAELLAARGILEFNLRGIFFEEVISQHEARARLAAVVEELNKRRGVVE